MARRVSALAAPYSATRNACAEPMNAAGPNALAIF